MIVNFSIILKSWLSVLYKFLIWNFFDDITLLLHRILLTVRIALMIRIVLSFMQRIVAVSSHLIFFDVVLVPQLLSF